MASKILLKKSSQASKIPTSADLSPGELAINLSDRVLYSKDTANNVFLIAAAPKPNADLTGIPTAPTADAGTNTTQVATTAFVKTAVANLVSSAPSTLDTLNELATALGNDPNFATTLATTISTKAPLASPTFTGTVGGITKSMVGLGNVDNTSDISKPISTAQQTALDNKVTKISSTDNALARFNGTTGDIQNSGVVVDDNGNIGINTTAPVSKLHIASSASSNVNFGTVSIGGAPFDGISAGKYVGHSSGTSIAVNEVSGFVGYLLDMQVAGVRRFSITPSTMNFTNGYIIAQSFQSSTGEIGTNFVIPLNIGLKSTDTFTTASTAQINIARATMAQTSGNNYAVRIVPIYNQTSGTASNTDLLINRTQTAIGSGVQYLFDAQVSGVTQFSITNAGKVYIYGSLGIGTTTSSVYSDFKGIELGSAGNGIFGGTANSDITVVSSNAYPSGSSLTCKYGSDGLAGQYRINSGVHSWYTAPSGTAGANVTFTEMMSLDGTGLSLFGTPTAPTATAGTNTTQIATTAFVESRGIAAEDMALALSIALG